MSPRTGTRSASGSLAERRERNPKTLKSRGLLNEDITIIWLISDKCNLSVSHPLKYLIKVEHPLSVGQPRVQIQSAVDDEVIISAKHCSKTSCKHLPQLNIQLCSLQFFLLLLKHVSQCLPSIWHLSSSTPPRQSLQPLQHRQLLASEVPVPSVLHQILQHQAAKPRGGGRGGRGLSDHTALWRQPKLQQHLTQFLNEFSLIRKLGKVFRSFDAVVVNVHKAQVSLC